MPAEGRPRLVVLLLHGSTKHSNADELSPVRFLEDEIKGPGDLWGSKGALLVFLAGRAVGGQGQFCWGAGIDNGLCTAPREGAQDESFIFVVLEWLRLQQVDGGSTPTYLYGHSGGGRMSWRAACNHTLAPRLAGVFATSALLAEELRATPTTCNISTMPPIIITHGTRDTTTDITFADESVTWTAAAADCSRKSTVHVETGTLPAAELMHRFLLLIHHFLFFLNARVPKKI